MLGFVYHTTTALRKATFNLKNVSWLSEGPWSAKVQM